MARVSRSRQSSRRGELFEHAASSGAWPAAQRGAQLGQAARLSRRAERSRGRALRRAMRAVMRSTSARRAAPCAADAGRCRPSPDQFGRRPSWRWAAALRSAADGAGVAQPARAHAGGAGVEQGEQGGRRLAAQGLGEFQVAPGGGVQAQEGALALEGERGDVGQGLVLRGAGVLVQGAGAASAGRHLVGGSRPGRACRSVVSRRRGGVASKLPVGRRRTGARSRAAAGAAVGHQHLGRAQAFELGGQLPGSISSSGNRRWRG
jgi:hypothetical protein